LKKVRNIICLISIFFSYKFFAQTLPDLSVKNFPDTSNLKSTVNIPKVDESSTKVNSDSLKKDIDSKKNKIKDSLSHAKKNISKNKKFAIGGSVNNQFDYRAIPYYMANNTFPASLYKSNGTVNVRFGKIPLIADYFYANPKFISGLNNYFTVRFDVNEFQNLMNKDYLTRASKLKTEVDSLSIENQKLKQQVALLENKKLNKIPGVDIKNNIPPIQTPQLPDDSLKINYKKDSINIKPILNSGDSLRNIYAGLDTSSKKINDLKNKIEDTEKIIEALKQKIAVVENPKAGIYPGSVYPQSQALKALEGVKRFEVGMCYPSYSTFMINQMAIKGVNTKYEYKDVFFNATFGKTVVNYSIQPTTNAILNQIQSLTTYFDWNKNPNEKKIGAFKVGYGKEHKNYIAVGGLYGKGTTSPNSIDIKNNYVVELDGRYVYEFLNFEGAVAKSFLTDKNTEPINSEIAGNPQKTNWDKSFQGKLYGTIPKVKTKFTFLYRTVEPYFKSFGVGFMRSDIQRYETKLEQPFGNKFRIGFNFRRDEDNLKRLFNYKTILENYTYYSKVKLFKKRMDITLNYTEIFQRIHNSFTFETKLLKSNIKTGIVSYSPRFRKLQTTNTIICNIYELDDGIQKNQLENYSFSSFNRYKKWQVNSLNSFAHNTIKDSLNFNNAFNNTIEIGYEFSEKCRLMIGGKHAYSFDTRQSQFGYSGSLNVKIHSLLNFEIKMEKLVIGDFINTLNYPAISQFPYYGYAKLTSSF